MGRSSRSLPVNRPRSDRTSEWCEEASVALCGQKPCGDTLNVAVEAPLPKHPRLAGIRLAVDRNRKDFVKHDTTTGRQTPPKTGGRPRFSRSTLRLRPRTLRPLEEGPVNDNILRRDRVYRRGLAYADTVAAALALYVAVVVLGENDTLRPAALLALPIVIVASKLIGLYDRDELRLRKSTLEEAPALFQLATLYALVVALLATTFVDGELGRSQLFGLWGCLFGFTILCRALARAVAGLATEPERCLVLGETETTESLC